MYLRRKNKTLNTKGYVNACAPDVFSVILHGSIYGLRPFLAFVYANIGKVLPINPNPKACPPCSVSLAHFTTLNISLQLPPNFQTHVGILLILVIDHILTSTYSYIYLHSSFFRSYLPPSSSSYLLSVGTVGRIICCPVALVAALYTSLTELNYCIL
jgi:hypothetical protein